MKEWCGVMNIPYSLNQDAYSSHHKKIHGVSFEMAKLVHENSTKPVRYADKDTGILPDKNGVLKIAVIL